MLTDEVMQVFDDHLGIVCGVDGALQERRPRAQLRFLQTQTFHNSLIEPNAKDFNKANTTQPITVYNYVVCM